MATYWTSPSPVPHLFAPEPAPLPPLNQAVRAQEVSQTGRRMADGLRSWRPEPRVPGKVRQMDGSAGLTGPVAGPPGIIMTGFDLGQVGYTLEEFFLGSTATC